MRLAQGIVFGLLLITAACAPESSRAVASDAAAYAIASSAVPSTVPGAAAVDLEQAAGSITGEAVRERVNYLASDELRGRDTPSPGLEAAARYIAEQFEEAGVEPAGEDGTYFQRWPYPVVGLSASETTLAFQTRAGEHVLDLGPDFAAEPGTAGLVQASPVFTGMANEVDALSAARGNVAVVFLPGGPGVEWVHARKQARRAAAEAGARGIIFVLDPTFGPARVKALSRELGATQRVVGEVEGVPTVFVSYDALRGVFEAAGKDLDAIRQRAYAGGMTAVPMTDVTTTIATPVDVQQDNRPANVVGIVRGSDPELRNTYVVLTAHMDHVGSIQRGGNLVIYNGADDNASGTTAVVMVARALASLDTKPARSVVFLLVSGEEKGLLGSRWWVEHPTVPIQNVVANINMDMIGRNHPDSVSVLGQEYSSLGPLMHRVNNAHPELNLTLAPDLWPMEGLFFRSDQCNFAWKEIPNLFLFAGLHEDYHQPSDTPDKLNVEKIARIARLVLYTTYEIAQDPQPPQWTRDGLSTVRMMTRNGC